MGSRLEMQPTRQRLSKSKYMAGLQCPKLLWWQVHEPEAQELVPDVELQARFDTGHRVGALAQDYVPGGVLIEADTLEGRLEATREALARGTSVLYEAVIEHDGALFIADILERRAAGWILIEVKSSTKVKTLHLPDLAMQLHVARGAGLDARRAELMHLNRDCRYPDLSNLFVRSDQTREVEKLLPMVPDRLASFRKMLSGPLPDVDTGGHCTRPHACPFLERCWTRDPPLTGTHQRMRRSPDPEKTTVRPGLATALAAVEPPIAYLDFETVAPAVPVWDGCRPYDQVPVQVSVHVEDRAGGIEHHEWLARGGGDPRGEMAREILLCTERAVTILTYSPFEERVIRDLQDALPHLAHELERVLGRIVDLLPIVRKHVHHPDLFEGYSLKNVLPVLVPGQGYGDLDIADGQTASAMLENMLLHDEMTPEEIAVTRKNLLDYCRLDTLAMVRLVARLRELAGGLTP